MLFRFNASARGGIARGKPLSSDAKRQTQSSRRTLATELEAAHDTTKSQKAVKSPTTDAKDIEKNGGREGIRTPGLLIANEEKSKLRRGATIT